MAITRDIGKFMHHQVEWLRSHVLGFQALLFTEDASHKALAQLHLRPSAQVPEESPYC